MTADDEIANKVRVAMMRMRHNTLADIEEFCTGSAAKCKTYAPLLRHIAKWKAAIRINIQRPSR